MLLCLNVPLPGVTLKMAYVRQRDEHTLRSTTSLTAVSNKPSEVDVSVLPLSVQCREGRSVAYESFENCLRFFADCTRYDNSSSAPAMIEYAYPCEGEGSCGFIKSMLKGQC